MVRVKQPQCLADPLFQIGPVALERLGARFLGEVDYAGATFRKYRLDTM